jgi:hypothetical protein
MLNVCVVREISASNLSLSDRSFVSRHGTRNPTGFEDVFCSGWVCPFYHRGIVAFIRCMFYLIHLTIVIADGLASHTKQGIDWGHNITIFIFNSFRSRSTISGVGALESVGRVAPTCRLCR